MVRPELGHAAHSQELHGPTNLPDKNFSRPFDARLTAGHEPVQVRSTDERSLGAERHSSNDVSTTHDACVHPDLGARTDCVDDFWDEPQRNRGTVELTATVIGQHDRLY